MAEGSHVVPVSPFSASLRSARPGWARARLIIEIDGGPFHLDAGADARKEAAWVAAGWTVRRLPSDDVYQRPERLLTLAAPANVPR